MPNTTIIIPVFNKVNFTVSCLNDLFQLEDDVEIVVVNNASTDETAAKLEEYKAKDARLKVINNTVNTGFGFACNQSYQNSTGENVLFLNNDIRVKENHKNWVSEFVRHCSDNNIISPTGGKVDPKKGFQFLYETTDPSRDINYLSGWCLAAKRSVFDKLIEPDNPIKGPFSKNFFCYFEDTHLSFIASELDIKLEMVKVPVIHFGKISSKQLNTFELYTKSKDIFNSIWKNKKK